MRRTYLTKILGSTLFALLIFLNCPFLEAELGEGSAVSYTLSGGRFGDNLLAYAHGKWISYILDVPLIYTPFPYSHLLALDRTLPPQASIERVLTLQSEGDFLNLWNIDSERGPIRIDIPFYPETSQDFDTPNCFPVWTQVNWDDPKFSAQLQREIAPLIPIPKFDLPADCMTVAVHVRTGEGEESSWARFTALWPMKGPPPAYYINALHLLAKNIPKPLYVYLFTDYSNPAAILALFAASCKGLDIEFDCRKLGNTPNRNVLEDFFSMAQFDCLIRSDSSYSLMASKLFPYQIVASPYHFKRGTQNQVLIDKILLQMNVDLKFPQPIKIVVPIH
ncbi:MAG: hypothetical protein A3E80_01305 [Chlamydiae bacterium RIFCSPHIGHO2_12_FULL_49_9]|nr:MAG: hypothetical protein A3E80_01305 [Chlamydiae bacterium RIFCSPHIGHO2_12_FULL_49_9]